MERLHLCRIAISPTMWACIAIEAAAFPASIAERAPHMRKTGTIVEALHRKGIDRAGIHARFSETCIAEMNRLLRHFDHNLMIEQERAAIGMPEPVFGMHENTQRRRLQPLGPHRPLLERQERPVAGPNGPCPETCGDRGNDLARPGIERIFLHFWPFALPAREMRP